MDRGFSLVELSIVLVILGLLTGGILGGQALIRAAELRSVSSDYSRYVTAAQTFRSKYLALPGDMANATRFWGAQAGGTADGVDAACAALTTAATGAATCNGDGDGLIGDQTVAAERYEAFRMWQHMANAELIEGAYGGVSADGVATGRVADVGVNVPKAKMGSANGFNLWTEATMSGSPCWWDGPFGNMLQFGAENSSGSTANPALRPEEAWNIDTKMDDGRPAYGAFRAPINSCVINPNCTTTDVASTAAYSLTNIAIACSVVHKLL